MVDRKTGMFPVSHARGELAVEAGFGAEEVQDPVAQGCHERFFGDGRQDAEGAGRVEHAVGDQRMDVRVEGDQVTEGLHVEDEAGPALRGHGLEALAEQSRDDLAEPGEQLPPLPEIWPHQFRQGEHVLAVGDGGEHVFLDPFAVGQHALLVAARTEVAGLAGEDQEIIMAAAVAVDPGETLMQRSEQRKAAAVVGLGRLRANEFMRHASCRHQCHGTGGASDKVKRVSWGQPAQWVKSI